MQVHLLIQVKEGNASRHPKYLVWHDLLDIRLHLLILLMDVAYDLLDQILQGHHAGHAAVLVDEDGQLVLILLHLLKERVRPAVLRHKIGLGQHGADVQALQGALSRLNHQCLCGQNADDVVDLILIHRYLGVHGLENLVNISLHRLIDVNGHHILTGHHNLTGPLVVKGKDGCDHLFFYIVKYTRLASCLEHGLDLLLGHLALQGLAVHADQLEHAAGGERKELDERIHHQGEHVNGAHAEQAEALRLLQSDPLGHKLTEDQVKVGQDNGHHNSGNALAVGNSGLSHNPSQNLGDTGSRRCTGEEARQCDSHLNC